MNQLQPIVKDGQRVLTTSQLAESYGTETKTINRNFQRNSDRYVHGKHYFALSGDELKEFKGSRQFDDNLKYASVLYLWTEKGAWFHAKSLNTDKAWNAYEMLVDDYYRVKDQVQPNNTKLLLQTALKHEEEIEEIKSDVKYLKDTMRIDGIQEKKLQNKAKSVAIESLGGMNSNAYKNVSRKVFSGIWRDFNNHFQLPRYAELPRKQFEDGMRFLGMWQPSTSLRIEIDELNLQQTIQEVI